MKIKEKRKKEKIFAGRITELDMRHKSILKNKMIVMGNITENWRLTEAGED